MQKITTRGWLAAALIAGAAGLPQMASADTVRITEWQYNGSEFIEFTNLGASAVDFTGWSFDDDSRSVGAVSLSGFGIVQSGQSVILSEESTAGFRTRWNLDSSVGVIGGNSTNLGRGDEINLYDAGGNLVDRLTYGDDNFPGTIRTLNVSGRPGSASAVGLNDVSLWVLAVIGDVDGSYASAVGGFIGSPGVTSLQPVPLPAAAFLMLGGLGMLGGAMRRKRAA